ncbi:hypothetical protein SNE40_022712 [Patella caerulea]|uniref:Uncharacterized protein n=1 Tax=Patella caerulea TaxID=87958 RepID=A0AAN8G4N2_PATCE
MGDSKQASFGDAPADRKYQDWYEWLVKRNFGGMNKGFGVQDNGKFLDWENMLKNGISKRQLSVSPDRFGSYGGYFSNGLQDWRRAFTGSKRQGASKIRK